MPREDASLDPAALLAGDLQRLGANEFAVYKPRWGAFYGTHLDDFLRGRGVDTIVFGGCNYPNCPRTSIYEASERDYRLVLLTDAVSRLDARGREDMSGIGVELCTTEEFVRHVTGAGAAVSP